MNIKDIGLSNNQLKIIAMVAMLADHAGKILLPACGILSVIGRLSFPIFAYMISEGCRYTRSRRKYLMTLLLMGIGCQLVYYTVSGSLYQNIFITFSLSVITVFSIDKFLKNKCLLWGILLLIELCALAFISICLPNIINGDFGIDYGFFGVILPVIIYYLPNKYLKLTATALIMTVLTFIYGKIQLFSTLSLPLLALYNGKRGKLNLKYLFYIFYPSHMAIIYLTDIIIHR